MSIKKKLDDLKEIFILFEDRKDKFVQLMDMAKETAGLDENQKIDTNKINGCTSQAWVVADANDDDTFTFRTDSDALIVKGLLCILEKVFSGEKKSDIISISSTDILNQIGLNSIITSQRTNGFSSAVEKIHYLVQ
tara:strand:- start:1129 stop:1536 length:408 start_codon:yes stop_codon:yes gene_type:complete